MQKRISRAPSSTITTNTNGGRYPPTPSPHSTEELLPTLEENQANPVGNEVIMIAPVYFTIIDVCNMYFSYTFKLISVSLFLRRSHWLYKKKVPVASRTNCRALLSNSPNISLIFSLGNAEGSKLWIKNLVFHKN